MIIAVDDEAAAREALEEAIRLAEPGAELHMFDNPWTALAFAKAQPVDVAFLDIRMPEITGISMAQQIKEARPQANIVFVTGHSEYALDAFSVHASGYVQKPVSERDIRREMAQLRHPPAPAPRRGVHIQCFGSFAVFIDGRLLTISRAKPRELLAYLVHKNGAGVTAGGIASVLWEDKTYDRSLRSQVQTAISQLMAILREAGIEDIVTRSWNSLALNKEKVSCDYFDLLEGSPAALNAYTGEYLADYSWAEFTAGRLIEKTRRA